MRAVRHRLEREAQLERAVYEVAHEHDDEDGHKAVEQLEIPEQEHVAQSAGHAEPRPLRQSAHDERDEQRRDDRRMHGAGALGAGLEERRHG